MPGGCGDIHEPWLSTAVLEFSSMNKRVPLMRLQDTGRKALINGSSEYPAILELLGGVLEGGTA